MAVSHLGVGILGNLGNAGLGGLGNLLNPPSAPKEDDPYFAALGRFIVAYASAEHQVHALARRLARVTDAKGRIIFSGMRLGDLADRVRGLLRATNASDKIYAEVDACIKQLDLIGTQRNKLVHRFVMYSNGKIFVTNHPIAKSEDSTENEIFTLENLKHMDTDCLCIHLRLTRVHDRREKSRLSRDTIKWLHGPWRYKLPPPAPKSKPRPAGPQSRKRQPPASRG
jgi:hypothetical protein